MFNKLNTAIQNISPNIRKIIANMGWLIGGRFLKAAMSFVVVAWTARYLGTDQFGTLNYAIALIAIFINISQMGLSDFVLRDAVREPSHRYEILGTVISIQLISGISSFLLIIGIIFALRPEDPLGRMIVIIMSSSLIFQNFYGNINIWFYSQVQSKYSVLSENIAFFIITVGRLILLQIKAPLIAFAILFSVESIITTINFIIAYQISGQKIQKWQANWQRATRMMKLSWPLIFSNLSVVIYLCADQVMLGQLVDSRAVGIYAVAVKLSENFAFLVLSLTRSMSSHIIEGKKISDELYYQRIQRLCNLLALIFYVVAIPLTFFATPLIILLFGQGYASAGIVLSVHIWSSIWMFFGNVKQVWIANEELTIFAMIASFTGAVMNIALNLWLIPIYKELGAAIATVFSYFFTDYIMCLIYPPTRKFFWVMTKALALNIVTQARQKA